MAEKGVGLLLYVVDDCCPSLSTVRASGDCNKLSCICLSCISILGWYIFEGGAGVRKLGVNGDMKSLLSTVRATRDGNEILNRSSCESCRH